MANDISAPVNPVYSVFEFRNKQQRHGAFVPDSDIVIFSYR